jgi:hypothetical protein
MNPPEKLYKYRKMDAYTIDTIVRSVIHFAEPSEFNDPFDCRLRPTNYKKGTEEEFREFFTRLAKRHLPAEKVAEEVDRKIREGIHLDEQRLGDYWKEAEKGQNETVGLFCLTENSTNILMWSHYADCHKGCCLEFSTVKSIFKTARIIKYPPSYPNHRFLDCVNVNKRELLYKLRFFTKANLWNYEQEWRVLFDKENEKGPGLYEFEKEALTGIIFGCQMIPEHKDLVRKLVANQNPRIQLYQAEPCKGKFKMEIFPISAP